jgi:hypothetical protein
MAKFLDGIGDRWHDYDGVYVRLVDEDGITVWETSTVARTAIGAAGVARGGLRRKCDGAFMEPRGCNWWRSAANRAAAESARTSQNRCRRLPPVAVPSAW